MRLRRETGDFSIKAVSHYVPQISSWAAEFEPIKPGLSEEDLLGVVVSYTFTEEGADKQGYLALTNVERSDDINIALNMNATRLPSEVYYNPVTGEISDKVFQPEETEEGSEG